jgi:hypothetical protein
MKRFLFFLVVGISSCAWAKDSATVLPKVFAGWQLQSVDSTTDPAKADSVYANLLKEYGFAGLETAHYAKLGRTMTVRLARFNDASGAYGAYSFYRAPQMAPEEIGDAAASKNEHVLFYRGNQLVEAKLDKITPMSAGELRELAVDLPKATGNTANLPSVVNYLPKQGLVANSVKYVSGPVGLAKLDSQLTPDLVDFSTGAEIASAQYKTGEGDASLTLISYPTPAVAGVRLRSIESYHPAAINGVTPTLYSKRTGPLVAVLTGSISENEAKTLLASVNYDADITWNQNTHYDKKDNIGYLLVNIIMLISIIFGLAIVAGLVFFGLRVTMKKYFPDRVFDRSQDVEIIQLKIGK